MRIALLSKADAQGGGASRVAEDLARLLLADGHQVVHFVSWTRQGYDSHRQRLYGDRWQRRFYRWSRAVRRWFAPDLIPFEWLNLRRLPMEFDLVHVHDHASAFSPLTIRWLAARMPLLWTLHDCSPFTGGCLYPMGCDRYLRHCGQCPQHGRWPMDGRFDYSALTHRVVQRVLAHPGVALAAPSQWLATLVAGLPWLNKLPLVIANGVDTALFTPAEPAREPSATDTILMAAGTLANPYKGFALGVAALRQVAQQRPLRLLVVGECGAEQRQLLAGLEAEIVGHVSDPAQMAGLYQRARLMLFPSLADNQPLQVLEAMACGLPVVALASGGVTELLKTDDCGWLAAAVSSEALADVMNKALAEPQPQQLARRQRCRARVVASFSHQQMLASYLDGYALTIKNWQQRQEAR